MTEESDLINAPPNSGTGKVYVKGIVPFRCTLVNPSPLRSIGSRWMTFTAK